MQLAVFYCQIMPICYNQVSNMKFDFKKRAHVLVLVAHPDDETIWLGGLLMRQTPWAWTVFSLCRASDTDRAPKFFQVCRHYQARGMMADLEDEGKIGLPESIPLIEELIKKKIGNEHFDYIFTHGKNGEYGHKRHMGVHLAVKKMLKLGYFKPWSVFYFNYKKANRKPFSTLVAAAGSDLIIKLTGLEFARKRQVMTDIYGFTPNSIDTNYCTNPEAFKIIKYNTNNAN